LSELVLPQLLEPSVMPVPVDGQVMLVKVAPVTTAVADAPTPPGHV